MRRAALAVLAAGCAALTAGCTSAGGDAVPTWQPSPSGYPSEGPGVSISPIQPQPPQNTPGSGGSAPGSRSGGSAPSSSAAAGGDPDVVATKLSAPTGIAILPDGSALVGERTSGRIVRVQPTAGKPTPVVKTITGLDTAGGGGLLDLALSPDFSQDNLVYAYVSTAKDNRVVEFTLDGPVTAVVTGIPRGASGNAGRLAFDADGDLYVGTGLAGSSAAAGRSSSLAGKVLRVDAIGRPVAGNSAAGSRIYTSGHQGVAGLCAVPQSATMLEVENGEINRLAAGGDYGFPSATSASRTALASLPVATPVPGDCAVEYGRIWITSPDGRSLLNAPLSGSGPTLRVGALTPALKNRYGRLLTVVAAPDGALWLTTTNRDGKGTPVAADDRVIRYLPSSSASDGGAKV